MEKDINDVIAELGDSKAVQLYRQLTLNNGSNRPLKELQKLFSCTLTDRSATFYYKADDSRKVKVKSHIWNSTANLEKPTTQEPI